MFGYRDEKQNALSAVWRTKIYIFYLQEHDSNGLFCGMDKVSQEYAFYVVF
jgi:hypothetical protein